MAEVLTGTDDSASSIVTASASLLRAGRIGKCVGSDRCSFRVCLTFFLIIKLALQVKRRTDMPTTPLMVHRVSISRVTSTSYPTSHPGSTPPRRLYHSITFANSPAAKFLQHHHSTHPTRASLQLERTISSPVLL